MITVNLPFSVFYVCEVCGWRSANKRDIESCEAVGMPETPDVKLGDAVAIFYTRTGKGDTCVLSEERTQCVADGFYYARPDHKSITRDHLRYHADRHQLFVGLALQYGHWQNMPWSNFVLWREGNPEKLQRAGLIDPPKPPRKPFFWAWWLHRTAI